MFFKWVARELLRSWKFGLFFIFNLSLGLTGYVSLEAFKVSLQDSLRENSKSILSADLAVSARRALTDSEKNQIQSVMSTDAEMSESYEFFAMMSSAQGSRLVMVRAIDQNYPLYGQLVLGSGEKIVQSTPEKEILKSESTWVYPELMAQMGLKNGDEVQLGQLKLKVADSVGKDGTQTFRAAALAPRIFISRELLAKSGLIQYGSTYSVNYFFKLKNDLQAAEKSEALLKVLTDPAIRVETSQGAGEDSGRQLGYLSDYLGLVAIIALFMSALGAAYLFRLFMTQRMREVAILRSLGLQATNAVSLYAVQVTVLGFLSLIPTVLVASVVLPLLSQLLASLTPFSLSPTMSWRAVWMALALGVVGSFVICLPFLLKIRELKPTKLFAEEKFSSDIEIRKPWVFLPGILLFWVLAVAQSNSFKMGSVFVGAFFAVLLVLFLTGLLLLLVLKSFRNAKNWISKYSLLGLSRRRASSLAIFIALGLGSLLINILPQLKNSLQNEFKTEEASKIPSLFMFDIQDEQMPALQDLLKQENIQSIGYSALVRARILKVNGQEFERKVEEGGFKTRESEAEARFRNRGANLSYREKISDSETISEGRPFSGDYDPSKQKYPEVSIEYRFADRLGINVGDVMTFDVQGVEIEGQVINLRKVKWTSFQPNFFVLLQNGVLNEAPKTFITALPKMSEAQKDTLQLKLAKAFPNVSIVDVQRTVNEVLKIADQMSWSLELMAALALFTGYVVLYSIVSSQMRLRRWELNMLKVVGASFGAVSKYLVTEFVVLSLGAGLIGAGLSVFVSYFISYYVFEGSFVFSWMWPLWTALGVCGLSALIAYLASRQVVHESPLVILQEER
ncbi:ABC transporter permease [Bdellovibrio sp. HCB337]|uniref:ABC transporter permease n=1 Tax=Bdellovibrio sp. HCB337 TaxID=3394358 RepID=UPI0039A5AF11